MKWERQGTKGAWQLGIANIGAAAWRRGPVKSPCSRVHREKEFPY
jgi:hypothetical protein